MAISCERGVTLRDHRGDIWEIDNTSCLFIYPDNESGGFAVERYDRYGNYSMLLTAYPDGKSTIRASHEQFSQIILNIEYESRYFSQASVHEFFATGDAVLAGGYLIGSAGEVSPFVVNIDTLDVITDEGTVAFEKNADGLHIMRFTATGIPVLCLRQAGIAFHIGISPNMFADVNFHTAGADAFEAAGIVLSRTFNEMSVRRLHDCLENISVYSFRAPHLIMTE